MNIALHWRTPLEPWLPYSHWSCWLYMPRTLSCRLQEELKELLAQNQEMKMQVGPRACAAVCCTGLRGD